MLTSSLATFELDGSSEVGDPAAPIPDLENEIADADGVDVHSSLPRDHLLLQLHKNEDYTEHAERQDPQYLQLKQSPVSPDR